MNLNGIVSHTRPGWGVWYNRESDSVITLQAESIPLPEKEWARVCTVPFVEDSIAVFLREVLSDVSAIDMKDIVTAGTKEREAFLRYLSESAEVWAE